LKSSFIYIDIIGVGEDGRDCSHGWKLAIAQMGDGVHVDREGCLHGRGLCLCGWNHVFVRIGLVCANKAVHLCKKGDVSARETYGTNNLLL
jgi:hypothetical protein